MFLFVYNIPKNFRTPDLRNFFFKLIEKSAFKYFHFRHRPEKQFFEEIDKYFESNEPIVKKVQAMQPPSCEDKLKVSSTSGLDDLKSLITNIKKTNRATSVSASILNKKSEDAPSSSTKSSNSSYINNDCTCCMIEIDDVYCDLMIQLYNNKHWVNKDGDVDQLRCKIILLNDLHTLDKSNPNENPEYFSRNDHRKNSKKVSLNKVKLMIEFKPPSEMPKGNVGTPTSFFKSLINSCQLPTNMIKKLELQFRINRKKRRFGEVPFSYGTDIIGGRSYTSEEIALTSKGDLIPSSYNFNTKKNNFKKSRFKRPKMSTIQGEDIEDGCDVEEWERYEAFHDDVTKQDRIKERRFEEDVEVTWDKGSSGLVFYTDAQYWREEEGGFDERTTDEWDVDMSGYYQKGAGDKDARDSIDMVENNRLKDGTLHQSAFKKPTKLQEKKKKKVKGPCAGPPVIGVFEAHTRGFARRLMESQGWREGDGLGRGRRGLPQALDNDGQHPEDKRGFGFYGAKFEIPKSPKETRSEKNRRRREFSGVYIGTAIDDLESCNPPVSSLRSCEPTSLSHFTLHKKFVKASEETI